MRVVVAADDVAKYDAAVGVPVAVSADADVQAESMPAVPPESDAPPTHTPLMAKHPLLISMPFEAVDEAVEPVRFRYVDCIPAAKVDVAVVLVEVM